MKEREESVTQISRVGNWSFSPVSTCVTPKFLYSSLEDLCSQTGFLMNTNTGPMIFSDSNITYVTAGGMTSQRTSL